MLSFSFFLKLFIVLLALFIIFAFTFLTIFKLLFLLIFFLLLSTMPNTALLLNFIKLHSIVLLLDFKCCWVNVFLLLLLNGWGFLSFIFFFLFSSTFFTRLFINFEYSLKLLDDVFKEVIWFDEFDSNFSKGLSRTLCNNFFINSFASAIDFSLMLVIGFSFIVSSFFICSFSFTNFKFPIIDILKKNYKIINN